MSYRCLVGTHWCTTVSGCVSLVVMYNLLIWHERFSDENMKFHDYCWYHYNLCRELCHYYYNIVFTLKARYDLNCVKSAVKLQPLPLEKLQPAVNWLALTCIPRLRVNLCRVPAMHCGLPSLVLTALKMLCSFRHRPRDNVTNYKLTDAAVNPTYT